MVVRTEMTESLHPHHGFASSARTLLVFPKAFEQNTVPPLGISLLAACLQQTGHEVDLLDLTVQSWPRLDYDQYCLIGMTLLCTNFPSGTELARRIRRANDSICIVAGGPFADACPKDVLDTGVFDVIAHGEGEQVLPALVSALKNNEDLADVAGISFVREGKVVRTQTLPMVQSLDALPFPAYELLPMKKYPRHSIMASRGCPFACIFCDRGPSESRKMRYLSPERVLDWTNRMITDYGCKPIRILDSTFTLNQEWAERICDLFIASRLEFRWHCQSRIDCVNPGLLKKMLDSGCTQFVAGVDRETMKSCGYRRRALRRLAHGVTQNCFRTARRRHYTSTSSSVIRGIRWSQSGKQLNSPTN